MVVILLYIRCVLVSWNVQIQFFVEDKISRYCTLHCS